MEHIFRRWFDGDGTQFLILLFMGVSCPLSARLPFLDKISMSIIGILTFDREATSGDTIEFEILLVIRTGQLFEDGLSLTPFLFLTFFPLSCRCKERSSKLADQPFFLISCFFSSHGGQFCQENPIVITVAEDEFLSSPIWRFPFFSAKCGKSGALATTHENSEDPFFIFKLFFDVEAVGPLLHIDMNMFVANILCIIETKAILNTVSYVHTNFRIPYI